MPKQITLELPEWANWIAQGEDECIKVFSHDPTKNMHDFYADKGEDRLIIAGFEGAKLENWRDSKINLNTHGAYIDADGILHRCGLVPDMLKEQA